MKQKHVHSGLVELTARGSVTAYLDSNNEVRLISAEQASQYHWQMSLTPAEYENFGWSANHTTTTH